jgi:hypothetical protein
MHPNIEKIKDRAYKLYKERIGNSRAPLDDWLKAEWEIKNSPEDTSENATKIGEEPSMALKINTNFKKEC